MTKKLAVFAVVLAGLLTAGTVSAANINYVNVDSCTQVGKDIRVKRSGKTSLLTSTCRDAGHGYRNYNLTCVSSKQYKVAWTTCSAPTNNDNTAPIVSLSINKTNFNKGETVRVTATANDNVKVSKIELYRNDVLIATKYDVKSANFAMAIGESSMSFYAKAYDTKGNVTKSQTVTAYYISGIDNVIPEAQIVVNNNVSGVNSNTTVTVNAGDWVNVVARGRDNVNPTKIELYLDGSLIRTSNGSDINYSFTAVNSVMFDVYVYDAAGHKGHAMAVVSVVKNNNTASNVTIVRACDEYFGCNYDSTYYITKLETKQSLAEFIVRANPTNAGAKLLSVKFKLTGDLIANGVGDNKITLYGTYNGLSGSTLITGVDSGSSDEITVNLYPGLNINTNSNFANFYIDSTDSDFQASTGVKRSLRLTVTGYSWTDNSSGTYYSNNVSVTDQPLFIQLKNTTDTPPTVTATSYLGSQNTVVWFSATAKDDKAIKKAELYYGATGIKSNDNKLIRTCEVNDNYGSTCAVSIPVSILHNGYYWAKAWDSINQVGESDIKYFNW
ncbi:MAG: Fibronectin, type III domain protein [Candidatus Magasanikbacteria bacterium GW2011_GWA2_37_8]|uniref:Fibronectin, type III domain protein n=1 Tax=Candidatus Magasanikbacteria bacterium GW2011_GWA2_37_8 TaxID=1619036 RepID=A0A0G0HF92_9BACT|nr:MAG: Fibronectin, type III domain protein [Candidatus Magasanikbacteria bacterium GW2011_GWA2_37_8]